MLALGTCAAFGGIPAMRNNPTGAMGLRDYLGWNWTSRRHVPIINLPAARPSPTTSPRRCSTWRCTSPAPAPMIDVDEHGRPRWLFGRTVQQGCGRAGFAEQGEFARTPADHRGCLVKLGCKGPVAKCNVPLRGWVGGVGGCPNVGGICNACTMPGFPDKFMPFMDPNPLGLLYAAGARFTLWARPSPSAPARDPSPLRRQEPSWRAPGGELTSGYKPRW